MAHYLPPHGDPNLGQHGLPPGMPMDPNQPPPPPPQHFQGQQPPPMVNVPRKRKKVDPESGEPASPAEPRRLRRSHEACARCRSKKIKCDSKHPRCTACASAGVQCHQEDRHRQTLVARGHTEHIERQLYICFALLKRQHPDFDPNNLEDMAARAGIDIQQPDVESPGYPYAPNGAAGSNGRGYPLRSEGPPHNGEGSPPRGYPYPPHPPHMMPPPGYPGMPMSPYPPYPPHHMAPMQGPPPPFQPHPHPHLPPPAHTHPFAPPMPPPHQQTQAVRPPSTQEMRGNEPLPHDLSTSHALAKNFGVSAAIVGDLKLAPPPADTEDLAVGDSGLASRRDRDITQPTLPRDAAKWVSVPMRSHAAASPTQPSSPVSSTASSEGQSIWLPKDRATAAKILDVYFARLNFHRPVFFRHTFDKNFDALYNGTATHDPGFVCSVYLVLALGTLSELNHRVSGAEKEGQPFGSGAAMKKHMPPDWPSQEEFFDLALAVKPDLRVTISSLQALILLHWYLYTERQGRTLWRLVGSLVRLAIELGLHHDPHVPPSDDNPESVVFTEEECQLRIRLWAIVLVHDRGTSILLGRPLAIAPSDSNTPRPSRGKGNDMSISEHFVLSAPIAEIQADIINSLYAPTRQSADSIIRHATRIIKSMYEFRRQLPEWYKSYFSGTDDWPIEKRKQLVQDITEDQGLTLLKIGITRILLLRALFSSKELPFHNRLSALIDAIVTSHNIIVVHHQLIKFPDIAFFVSPIPLHIAAMVILYGHMSKCDRLPREVALEDVWMALDMLPSFRWRWERKDLKGGHPLIAKLAEEVLKVNLHQVAPNTPPMLISEADWDTEGVLSPKQLSQHPGTPTLGPAQYPQSPYTKPSPTGIPATVKSPTTKGVPAPGPSPNEKLAEIPPGLFYPFYPESQPPNAASTSALLNATQVMSSFGFQPSQESFVLEEKDASLASGSAGIPWSPNGQQDPRAMAPFQMP